MAVNSQAYLTTFDNKFDPSDDFFEWFMEDIRLGHACCETLARNAHISDMLTDNEQAEEIERAIDAIIKADPEHIYHKVRAKTQP